LATPLFLALLTIEFTDVVFAIESIPAIFAITLDPFIVFTSNIFAILGLRSLYFVLANIVDKFYYINHAISLILGYVGVKLMIANFIHIPVGLSLTVIAFILAVAMLASLWKERNK
jgi:tellurite resistance protein TerC